MILTRASWVALTLCAVIAGPAAVAAPPLVAQKPVVVPGPAGGYDWMAVDEGMHRLLAGHKGTGTLAVLDLHGDRVIASVPTGAAQGVAVDALDDKIFVGDDTEQMVVVLNRKDLAKIAEIKVSGPVDAIAFDPKNRMAYADHDDGTEVWVIDARENKLVGSVTVPGAPEFVEYDADTDRLYQNIKVDNTIQVIDPNKNSVEAVWSTLPAESPHGLAIDHKTQRVFSAGNNGKLVVIDMRTGKAITSVDIAAGTDQIAFDPGTRRVYCACRGAISVVQETDDGATSLGNVPAPPGSHTLTVDPHTHAVWVSYADKNASYLQKYTMSR